MEIKKEDLKILFTEEQIKSKVREVANVLTEFYKGEEVTAVCVLKGGVIFATDIVRCFDFPVKMEFIRLSSYGSDTETSGKIKVVDMSLSDLNGKNVLILEDILDSGLTAKFLVDYINSNYKVKTLKFCSFLNKKVRRKVEIEPDYYCYDVDDRFVVGYGLDYDEHFRNLPYIAYKE